MMTLARLPPGRAYWSDLNSGVDEDVASADMFSFFLLLFVFPSQII
jgi:hypothetical protein